jgi:RecA-family ATPase
LIPLGIKAFLFTTGSYTPDAPRFRVLLPFGRERTPAERETYVRRANGILGGVLSAESFNMSQAFFAGRVAGVVFDYRVTDGAWIDEVDGLPEIGRPGGNASGALGYTRAAAYDDIEAGQELHRAINYLCMIGEPREEIEAAMHGSAAKGQDERRWQKRFDEIPRSIRGAERRRKRDLQKTLAGVGTPPRYSSDTPAPRASVFETITAASLAGQPIPPQQWLARDLIPAGQPVLLSGDGGLGKSLLALQLAAAVASGGRWLGDYVQQGAALYMSAEDEIAEIHRRLSWITSDLTTLDRLHLAPMAELDPLLVATDRGKLNTTALYDAVAARVEEIRPALVVLDSAADYFGGNEVVRSEVRWFIGQLRKLCHATGCTVLILSHPSVSGMASGSGLSGSTHWNNSVRARLYLTRPGGGEDADRDERVLEVMKNNRGPLGKRVVMRWSAGAFVAVDNSETGDASAEADAVFLELLTSYTAQQRYANASGGPSYAPTMFAKDEVARKRHVTKSALVASMNRLLRQNRIIVETRKSSGHERRYLRIADTLTPSLPLR